MPDTHLEAVNSYAEHYEEAKQSCAQSCLNSSGPVMVSVPHFCATNWSAANTLAGGTPAHLRDSIGALVGLLAHVASVHGKSSRGAGSLANLSILEPIFPLNFFVLIFSARE